MIAVTGATGQLGTAFRKVLPEARFLERGDLDLGDIDGIVPTLTALAPSGLINCAAYTAVDRAEGEEDRALLINAAAVGVMATYAVDAGVPFVTFSTDYVFDGAASSPYLESSPTAPINTYGSTKLAGEQLALEAHPGALVIRTSWVISGTHPNFVATMLRLADERPTWRVVDDQVGCPTVVDDLAVATVEALDRGITGVLHLTNQGETTWFDLARETLRLAGEDPARVEPCSTEDYPTPARRPAYSVLGSERAEALGLAPLPSWRESLPGVVQAQVARHRPEP